MNLGKLLKRQRDAAADVHGAIRDLRERITLLQDERQRVAALPVPVDMAMAAVDGWLDGFEGKGIRASAFASGDKRDLPFLTMDVHSPLPGLLVQSCRAAIRAALEAELQDYLEGRETATPDQRSERMGAVDAQLIEAEKAEERAIRDAEAAGLPILRRREARPEIVLLPDSEL